MRYSIVPPDDVERDLFFPSSNGEAATAQAAATFPTASERFTSAVKEFRCLQYRLQQLAHFRGIACDFDAAGFHHGKLLLRRAFTARDNGARVAHALAWGSGDACDEPDDWLLHVILDPLRRSFLVATADFTDHHHGVRFWVIIKQPQYIHMLKAIHWITADADRGRLTQSKLGDLRDGFVS